MIKVVIKRIYDDFKTGRVNHKQEDIDKATFKLLNTFYSEKDGYVAVCERLKDYGPCNSVRIGDLEIHKISDLRVVHADEEETEREKYLTEIITILKK